MGFIRKQLLSVIEWNEYADDQIFWKWNNDEIKDDSKIIIRPGQDAVFLLNGELGGIFEDSGEYSLKTDIAPFISQLKGWKFGFDTASRTDIIFVNTKEFTDRWGTKSPISLPVAGLPGGMPIRAFGTYQFKVSNHQVMIEKIAGVKNIYRVEDVHKVIESLLSQKLTKHIVKEGKGMFNIQANADAICRGIQEDLDMELMEYGLSVTKFHIASVNYPDNISKMRDEAAAQSMVGDLGRYQAIKMTEAMSTQGSGMRNSGVDMAQAMMGMTMGQQMVRGMINNVDNSSGMGSNSNGQIPKFCPNCGTPTNGMKFCGNCGFKLG